MRSTTTTIETNIPADRLVEIFAAGAAAVVLAVSGGWPTGAVGTAASATGVLTGSAGVGAAAGIVAGLRGRADGRVW
jgi:hypothetical protein